MLSISQDCCPAAGQNYSAEEGHSYYGFQSTSFSKSQEKKTDIVILTEEGDRVTLSRDSKSYENYSTYSYTGKGNGVNVQGNGESSSLEMSKGMSLSVEGDLNEQELKDIYKAVRKIDKIMTKTLSGDMEKAARMLSKVSDLDSISSFSAKMELKSSMSYSQQTMVETQSALPKTSESAVPESVPRKDNLAETIVDRLMDVIGDKASGNHKLIGFLSKHFSRLYEETSERYDGQERREKLGLIHDVYTGVIDRIGL